MVQVGEVTVIEKAFKSGQKDDEGNTLPLGSIKVRVGGANHISGNVLHRWCRPAWFGTRRVPLVGEHVLIFPGPVHDATDGIVKTIGYYYISPVNATDDLVLHQMPRVFWRAKGNANPAGGDVKPGKSFPNNPKKVDFIQPFEGDELFESRLGSSMRFGSSVSSTGQYEQKPTWQGSNGDPITILRVLKPEGGPGGSPKYTIEDISKDDSSVYLTSGQKLQKIKGGFDKNLDVKQLATFGKPQVVLNAQRIVLNATDDMAMLIGAKKSIVTGKEVIFQSDKYNVNLDDLMDYVKKIVQKVTDLTSGTKFFATPAGPTSTATSVAEWQTMLNVEFKTNFELP